MNGVERLDVAPMKRITWITAGLLGAGAVGLLSRGDDTCRETQIRFGLDLPRCPSGRIRQTVGVEVDNVRRGAKSSISLAALAHYTVHDADATDTAPVPEFTSIALTLVDAKHLALPIVATWATDDDSRTHGTFALPEVPDGDYQLHAVYETRLGKGELDVPVPLYTPARIHVLTDRPLYEPGNQVHFRAVVLRARDLAPIDGRPGSWVVKDPNGEVLLEEKAPAGDWGVVAGSFPLDKSAATGTWKVAWVSAGATDEIPFTVEPFKLPRFRVDTQASKPFYQAGETPAIHGAVIYSSGAPVANANLDITWDVSGDWPPPTDWALPKHAVSGTNGRFELALPKVPADLQNQVTLVAHVSAVDPAGDRVEGMSTVLLSQDAIQASAVTELDGGLVGGSNNRMYLRVATADGRALAGTKIHIKRAWQPTDNGIDAELDEDGVASLQIDPGAPVNIVIPAVPYRPAPRPPLVTRNEVDELIGGEHATLVDQEAMDRWLPALESCAKWVSGTGEHKVRVGLRVDASGAIIGSGGGATQLERCVRSNLVAQHLPAGRERMYGVSLSFADPDLPVLAASIESALALPDGLGDQVQSLASGTRDCLPTNAEGELPLKLAWRARAGEKSIELSGWIRDPHGAITAATAIACVQSRIAGRIALAAPATSDSLGLVRFTTTPAERERQAHPQPTTMLGYELLVSADGEGNPATKLRVAPGNVPQLRLRVTPVLPKPGETITAELIRGPSFAGELPKTLGIECLKSHATAKLDAEHRATFAIPAATEGWCSISGAAQRALVYVRPQSELAVTITANDRYRPGDKANLQIHTTLGGRGGKAAVGLFGVDESLGQLVTLPGASELGRVRPQVRTSSPAFGMLDGQALTLGRIRGANAAAATVLRVSEIPGPPELDAFVSASAQSHFDPIEELTDHFYTVLAELHAQTRAWEATAPQSEKMRPATMAKLWSKALDACTARGEHVEDAYGRRLRLSLLPPDLLALTDPRAVVVVGTRLPEDVENWTAWVAKETP